MAFSTLEFIFIFLPIFFLVYIFADIKYKNLIMLLASLIFYFIGAKSHPLYIPLTLISVYLNYRLGILIGKKKSKKKYLILGLLLNFGYLFIFKYFDFFSGAIASINGSKPLLLHLALPLGISFYTFQVVSYLIDVYRKKIPSEENIIKFSAYIMMFIKFISGPITSYDQVKPYLDKKKNNIYSIELGIKYFVIGLGFKVLIANRIGGVWAEASALGYDSISTPLAWLAAISYSLQLYFDFHGYTMMAKGIGKILGMDLPDNFDHPYISKSMTEFWRRWHMTLGRWFKNYIYIPLGGSKNGMFKLILSTFAVWLFTGLWHGADWNFVIWGLGLFAIIMIEKFFIKEYLDKYPWLGHTYMLILIPVSWTVFAVSDLSKLGQLLNRMFVYKNSGFFAGDYVKIVTSYWYLYLAGILFSTTLPKKIAEKNKIKFIENIVVIGIFWLSIYCLCTQANDPFMYFQF